MTDQIPVTMNTILCKMFGLSESQLRSWAKYHGVRKTAELIKQAQSLARAWPSAVSAGRGAQVGDESQGWRYW